MFLYFMFLQHLWDSIHLKMLFATKCSLFLFFFFYILLFLVIKLKENWPHLWQNSQWTECVTHKHSWPDPLGFQASSRPRTSRSPRQSGCRNSWSGLCLRGTQRSRRWSVCSRWSGPELSWCQNLCCGWPDRWAGREVSQASSEEEVHGKRTHFHVFGKGSVSW